MDRPTILDTAKGHVTKDRQAQHGKPENSFACIADFWTVYLRRRGLLKERDSGELHVEISAVDVASMMALLKTARAISNPANEDNWVDHAGYVACAGELATLQNYMGGMGIPSLSVGEVRRLARELNEQKSSDLTDAEARVVQTVLTETGSSTTEHDARFIHALHQKKFYGKL